MLGKIILKGEIKALTGIRVGGSKEGMKIGGVDSPVIKDANDRPYIPGSSLKGKLRSLLELSNPKKYPIGDSGIHICKEWESYKDCEVCKIFGITGTELKEIPEDAFTLTRIQVRDAPLIKESLKELSALEEDEFTEIKTEININRETGTVKGGGLRQIERVPAGAKFSFEFLFNILEERDIDLLPDFLKSMLLLEDDYLGGMGSRGYGKIKFLNLSLYWRSIKDYVEGTLDKPPINGDWKTPLDIKNHFNEIKEKIK